MRKAQISETQCKRTIRKSPCTVLIEKDYKDSKSLDGNKLTPETSTASQDLSDSCTALEEFTMVSVQSEVSAIRKEAITAMACCCLRSIENARQHMLLLLQAMHIDVHITTIIAVVDLLMEHHLSSFIIQEELQLDVSAGDSSVTPSRCTDRADSHSNMDLTWPSKLNTQGGNSVVAILTKVLDDPNMELRTDVAKGLCNLIMISSINSPKLFSCLLLIW